VSPSIPTDSAGFLFELAFDAILLAGVHSVGAGRHRWPFLALTVVTLGVRWGEHFSGVGALDVGALFITVIWLVFAVSILIGDLFQRTDVTVDTILGAMVTYLLVAVAFTMVFEIIELRQPGSFSGVPDNANSHRAELGSSMLYFSLVNITTLGYGDIVPVSKLARPLADHDPGLRGHRAGVQARKTTCGPRRRVRPTLPGGHDRQARRPAHRPQPQPRRLAFTQERARPSSP